ncbi:MAG: hypothetical protein ACI81T_004031 [Bacteroidia bacterium]|jgi:hypothetical protein
MVVRSSLFEHIFLRNCISDANDATKTMRQFTVLTAQKGDSFKFSAHTCDSILGKIDQKSPNPQQSWLFVKR